MGFGYPKRISKSHNREYLDPYLKGQGTWVISRVISALNGVTLIITLLRTNLQSPLPLQVG